jgi:hypothetical protein
MAAKGGGGPDFGLGEGTDAPEAEEGTSEGGDGSGASGGDDTGDGGDDGDGGMPKLDVYVPDGDNPAEETCTAVDILFVIDNSGSMIDNTKKLIDAFPYFIDAVYDNLPEDTDLHVGITTGSFSTTSFQTEINCITTSSAQEVAEAYWLPPGHHSERNGEQGRLYEWEGKRFFSANTSDANPWPLTMWFSDAAEAAATQGGGAYEFLAAGAAYAAGDVNLDTNDGFFRDLGTILLIFAITDETDKSPEDLAFYRDMVLAKKTSCGGDACIITGGLFDAACIPNGNPGSPVWNFLSGFGEEPVWTDIEGEVRDYIDVMAGALAQVVGMACEEIPPQG